jgi:hypothetical protein
MQDNTERRMEKVLPAGVAEHEAAGDEVVRKENTDKCALVRVCPRIFGEGCKKLQ